MLRLMLGLLHPQEGERILIGETDGEKIAVDPSARRLFSYVPQGNTMFSGTIAENMRNVRPEASDEEICEVLKAACAWEFVEKLPDGSIPWLESVEADSRRDRRSVCRLPEHCFADHRFFCWMRRPRR